MKKIPVATVLVALLFVSVWAAKGSVRLSSTATIGVSAVPVDSTTCSNEINYMLTSPPAGFTIDSIVFGLGAMLENKGAFTINSLKVRCNSYTTNIPWSGVGRVTINDPNCQYARSIGISFCGTCVGGYYEFGVYVPYCTKLYMGSNLSIYYQY